MSKEGAKIQEKVFTGVFLLDMIMYLGSTCDTYILGSTFTTISSTYSGNMAIAGTLAGMYSIAAMIMRPFAGKILDRFGKRRTITVASAFVGVVVAGYMFCTSLVPLFVLRMLQGIGFSVVTAGCYATAGDLVPESRKTFGLGWYSNMATLASYIGPVIGTWGVGMYEKTGSWNYLYACGVFVCVWVCVLVQFLRYEDKDWYKEKKAAQKAAEEARKNELASMSEAEINALGPKRPEAPSLLGMPIYGWLFVLILVLVSGAHCSINNFLILSASERGFSGVGNYFLMQTIGVFIGRGVLSGFVDKYGAFKIVTPVLFIGAFCFVMFSKATSINTYVYLGILYGFMFGTVAPTTNSIVTQSCGVANTGFGAAMYLLSIDIGYGFFPTIWGFVINAVGYAKVYMYVAICPIVAFLLLCVFWFKWGKELFLNKKEWEKEQAAIAAKVAPAVEQAKEDLKAAVKDAANEVAAEKQE